MTASALDGVTGRWFDRQREARALNQAYYQTTGKWLWDISEEFTRLHLGIQVSGNVTVDEHI